GGEREPGGSFIHGGDLAGAAAEERVGLRGGAGTRIVNEGVLSGRRGGGGAGVLRAAGVGLGGGGGGLVVRAEPGDDGDADGVERIGDAARVIAVFDSAERGHAAVADGSGLDSVLASLLRRLELLDRAELDVPLAVRGHSGGGRGFDG